MTPTQLSNQARQAKNYFSKIDLNSADINEIETSIYSAITSTLANTRWSAYPISPLAAPVNLGDLFGDMFNGSIEEIQYQAQRIDQVYSNLIGINNVLKSSLAGIESSLTAAADSIESLNAQTTNQAQSYFWVSDNFSTTAKINTNETTALINTDYGQASLNAVNASKITDFSVSVDYVNTNGIPGCNLEVLDSVTNSDPNTPPQVTLNTSNTVNLSNMFDGDPNTWFEVERNFIPPVQQMTLQKRAWVSGNGQPEDVIAVTKNLDWMVTITWPNFTNDGPDGKGIPIAEFVDSNTTTKDTKVNFVFTLKLNTPQQISFVNLLPYSRNGESIVLNSLQVLIGSQWFTIATNTILGTNVNTTVLQKTILNQIGTQTTGSLYSVPVTQPVSQIKINLSSSPVSVPYGLAHAFQDEEQSFRTQRNYLFFNSVDKWTAWGRIPISSTPTNVNTDSVPGFPGESLLTGGLSNVLNSIIPGGLFGVQHSQTVIADVKGFDIFKGTRASIGIRDLGLSLIEYGTQSVLQSVELKFSGNVSNIGLIAKQVIPENWGPGNWIEYYVSEDGSVWSQIQPLTDTTIQNTYTTSKPLDTCYFKAVFNGNVADIHHSAILSNYALFGVPV